MPRQRAFEVCETFAEGKQYKVSVGVNEPWVTAIAGATKCDSRYRKDEDYKFMRCVLTEKKSKQKNEYIKVKGSSGPFIGPKRVAYKNMIYEQIRMIPNIFNKQQQQIEKNNTPKPQKKKVNKNKKKKSTKNSDSDCESDSSSNSESSESEYEDTSSIITDDSDGSSYCSADDNTNNKNNPLQKKNNLKRKRDSILQTQNKMIQLEDVQQNINYIKPVLIKHKNKNHDAMKAMNYLERLTGEYKSIGIPPFQWEFISNTFKELIGIKIQPKKQNIGGNANNIMNERNKLSNNEKSKFADNEIDFDNKTNEQAFVNIYDINYCNVCEIVLTFKKHKKTKKNNKDSETKPRKSKKTGEEIREHYIKHGGCQKSTDQCRICLIKFPNKSVLDSHYKSQHRSYLVVTQLLPDSIKCKVCQSSRQASFDGRGGYWKILCTKCNSKLKADTEVEIELLKANILSDEAFAKKYPLPHESKEDKTNMNIDNEPQTLMNPAVQKSNNSNDKNSFEINQQTAQKVMDWLHEFNLHCYYTNFVDNGFDSMDIVQQIESVSILNDIGIQRVAHTMIIMKQIEKLQ